jgi:hypothetical protein
VFAVTENVSVGIGTLAALLERLAYNVMLVKNIFQRFLKSLPGQIIEIKIDHVCQLRLGLLIDCIKNLFSVKKILSCVKTVKTIQQLIFVLSQHNPLFLQAIKDITLRRIKIDSSLWQ